jgi:16S rRNA (guanine527-N7)-methyltransferase
MRRHFLDSLSIYPLLLPAGTPWALIDVGSGAGFPGLPLKIVRPELQVTLLEATRKKGDFLRHVVERLGLAGVTVLTARAEEVAHHSAHREQYDLVVARAVAPLPTLAEYTLPLAKVGGRVIAQKGRHPAPEAAEASRAIEQCGGGGTKILPVQLPDLDAPRHLVMIEKRQATPAQYPRRAGTPARHPL